VHAGRSGALRRIAVNSARRAVGPSPTMAALNAPRTRSFPTTSDCRTPRAQGVSFDLATIPRQGASGVGCATWVRRNANKEK
jgi:hypothetical protein